MRERGPEIKRLKFGNHRKRRINLQIAMWAGTLQTSVKGRSRDAEESLSAESPARQGLSIATTRA